MSSDTPAPEAAAPRRRRLLTVRPWQRKWLWWMTYLCIGSGVGIFYLKFFVEKDFFSIWIHPTHPWLIAIHLITSPILIFVIGSLMLFHVIPHFRERDHFWSGNLALAMFLIYSITGMFLFFLFPEEVIVWLKWIHTISGFVFFPIIGYHWWTRYLAKPGGSFEGMVYGRAPLWKAFWIWGVAGGLGMTALYFLLLPFGSAAAAISAVLNVTWAVFVLTGVWRCAYNVATRALGHLARVGVAVAVLGMVWHVVAVADMVVDAPPVTQQGSPFLESDEGAMMGDDDAFIEEDDGFIDEEEARFLEEEEALMREMEEEARMQEQRATEQE